jgi:hypothetical protein
MNGSSALFGRFGAKKLSFEPGRGRRIVPGVSVVS